MFAANRNDSVIGRTVTLVVSISTRNGLSQSGAPSGRKCAMDFMIDLKNLDIIIDNHKGRPKINVKIKCLEVLKKYGIKPSRLIVIIEKKRVATVCLSPLRFDINVRDSCAVIISRNGAIMDLLRDDANQNVSCVDKISIMFIIIKSLMDGLIELNLYGSKEEKMSGIIQNMGDPFMTLKVISLVNLMFYGVVLRRLSHIVEESGFKM